MCLALYIASDRKLPLTKQPEFPEGCTLSSTWPLEAQRFHTAEFQPTEAAVQSHFRFPYILSAGSYEGCGCGFNFGREYPNENADPKLLTAARESVADLIRYVRESGVRQIYTCWSGDEAKPTSHERTVKPETLRAPDFFFREQELLNIDHGT